MVGKSSKFEGFPKREKSRRAKSEIIETLRVIFFKKLLFLFCAMLKKESKMAGRVNPNGPTRSRALLPPAMLGLGLLAAMAGHASAELGCKTNNAGTSNEASYLSDPENCHTTELNAAFDGRLIGCSGGLVRRVCSQMCTHHHPPTPSHTHSGQSVRPVKLLLQLLSSANESKIEKETAIQHACRGRGMNGTPLHPHSGTPGCCTRRSMPWTALPTAHAHVDGNCSGPSPL